MRESQKKRERKGKRERGRGLNEIKAIKGKKEAVIDEHTEVLILKKGISIQICIHNSKGSLKRSFVSCLQKYKPL